MKAQDEQKTKCRIKGSPEAVGVTFSLILKQQKRLLEKKNRGL
jgi:hypothetical protein